MHIHGEIQILLLSTGTLQLAVANDRAGNMTTGFNTLNSNWSKEQYN
jgi:hypothetical protein